MRYVVFCKLIRAAVVAGVVAAVLVGPANASRLADAAVAGRLNRAALLAEPLHSHLRGGVLPVTDPQGSDNRGSVTPGPITPGPMTPGPMTPGPMTPGPDQGPAFGTPNLVFAAGIWRIIRSQGEFYLWTDSGNTAIQITLDSNGWWGLRRYGDEKIVWSSGKTHNDPFYDRPWLRPQSADFPIATAAYQGRSQWGVTYLDIGNDQIRITLTDRGEIQLDTRTPTIVFRTGRGEMVTF